MSSIDSKLAWWAALLTRMSIPPSSDNAVLTILRQWICVLHVARHEHGLPAGVLHECLSPFGVVVLAEIGNQHVGAFARIGDRNRSTNTAVCTGDDRFLAGESTGAAVAALAVVGHRFHRLRFAGHWLFLLGKGRLGMRSHGRHLAN
jgi:hypothetical protein